MQSGKPASGGYYKGISGEERKDTTEQREAGGRVRGEEREREDSIREDNNEHEFLFLLPSGKLPIPSTHIPLRY